MLEGLKKSMLERIERDSVKSIMGNEVVYVKKSKMPLIGGDWQQIHLPVNEDGTWNWTNLIFGGKRNLKILLALIIIVGMVVFQFYTNFDYIETLRNNPCVQSCLKNPMNW